MHPQRLRPCETVPTITQYYPYNENLSFKIPSSKNEEFLHTGKTALNTLRLPFTYRLAHFPLEIVTTS